MSTTTSLDILHTQLHPTAPSQYLQHLIQTTLHRKGFEAGEAGALAEIERLLERHMLRLFAVAADYANLAHRSSPNAGDMMSAQEEGGYGVSRLRKEAKRRGRRGQQGVKTMEAPREEAPSDQARGFQGGPKLDYAFHGAPSLPGQWTYARPDDTPPDEAKVPLVQVTAASLDFVKSTATERGDISPELGLVHYRRAAGGGGAVGRRKWGVKGVGLP